MYAREENLQIFNFEENPENKNEFVEIHFIHAKPPLKQYKRVVPLLIVHGWPGNVFEFYKIIPMLTNPSLVLGVQSDLAFEVIAPSIPGYGWSDSAHKTGRFLKSAEYFLRFLAFLNMRKCYSMQWIGVLEFMICRFSTFQREDCNFFPAFLRSLNQWATARIFRKLMLRLGHNKFLLQGGDWGSLVCTIFAHYYPQKYFHRMALNDSPAGLAAYILQKFAAWTNREYQPHKVAHTIIPNGNNCRRFTMDELLTILSIYWFNGNIVNSQRYYKEYFISPQGHAVESYVKYISHKKATRLRAKKFGRIVNAFLRIPTAVASFPNDLVDPAPREIVECTYNVVSFTEMPFGGHFAAFEQPKLLARDIFKGKRQQMFDIKQEKQKKTATIKKRVKLIN
uniref:Epoxide hydrolase n=1 Tax=Parascaris equorum TaxID=6256 RepID=A0A914RM44_PAREQ